MTEIRAHYRKKSANCAEKLAEDLPIEEAEHTLPEDERICPECGEILQPIGKTERDTLVLIPAQAKIRRDNSYTYACSHCEKDSCTTPIKKAKLPAPVIKGSIASAEAAAHIAVQKFVMGIPLYRQEQEWERNGIPLSRQTMSNWLTRCAEDYFTPVWQCMKEQLVQQTILHADEMTLQVLHEEGKKPQSKSYTK